LSDLLIRNATLFTGNARAELSPRSALVCALGRIVWSGPESELEPERAKHVKSEIDAGGALVSPGLIDCHTHLIFGGSRAKEFEMRLAGADYLDIAAAGGGIASTVRATRGATDEELLDSAAGRLKDFARQGVTTVEIKSGYGLNTEHEVRMLRLAGELRKRTKQTIIPTFLGAHSIGPEFKDDRAGYIREIIEVMIPQVANERLASAVDVFCEKGAFTVDDCDAIFQAARERGLRVKAHAEQLSHQGGAKLAAQHGALSVDHLEYLKPEECELLAMTGTVAVLLPGAMIALSLPNPPVEALRAAGATIAIATDCNPGTSMTTNLLLMMQLAANLWRLSPAECLAGVTWNAARALNIGERAGRIAPGFEADLVLWNAESPADLVYRLGANPVRRVWKRAEEMTA
jgi:imidazolonepropionase